MIKNAQEILRNCMEKIGIQLTEEQVRLFNVYAEELKKWNRKINLTAIKDDKEIVIKHFVDSLSLLGALKETGTLLDIGSGGGFPSIPLKIILQQLSVVSVDAVEKKIMFQRHAARILQLHDFTAIHARVEELEKSYALMFDTIVSRAFSDLPLFVSLAMPLLKNSGQIIAMKGREGKEESVAAAKKLSELGAEVVNCVHLTLPISGDERYLVIIEKTACRNA